MRVLVLTAVVLVTAPAAADENTTLTVTGSSAAGFGSRPHRRLYSASGWISPFSSMSSYAQGPRGQRSSLDSPRAST